MFETLKWNLRKGKVGLTLFFHSMKAIIRRKTDGSLNHLLYYFHQELVLHVNTMLPPDFSYMGKRCHFAAAHMYDQIGLAMKATGVTF